jgi:hypothetical protein
MRNPLKNVFGNASLVEAGQPSNKVNILLKYASFALLLFGIKLWIISMYGTATPAWDQWDAEARNLYSPFLQGKLHFKDLFASHNEHRIFTTRLLGLLLLTINKGWNPLLQMVVNACVHVITIMVSIALLTRITGKNNVAVLLAFSLVLFGIPYAWENILFGFQVQFYFVFLFSVLAIWLLITAEPLSLKWCGGAVFGMLAFLSMASGVFAFAGAAAISLLIFILQIRRTKKQLLAGAILVVLFIAGAKLTPVIPGHSELKAASFSQFYNALLTVMGWPVASGFIASLIRNLPILLFTGIMLKKRPPANDIKWFLLALAAWSVGQTVSIAYGRAVQTLSSRYTDLYAITIFVNFACLLSLAQTYYNTKWRKLSVAGIAGWTGIVVISLGFYGIHYLPPDFAAKRETGIAQETNTRNYVITGDINYLKNKPMFFIPYPNATDLASAIEMPGIRSILPGNLKKPLQPESDNLNGFIPNGYYPGTPKPVDTSWGSYTARGDTAMGSLTLHFHKDGPGKKIEIPIAGYPLNNGMKLEIEQNGVRTPMTIESNPRETWGAAYAKITGDDFSIHLTDSSTSSWMAICTPVVLARLDGITTRTLLHFYVFLILGVAIVVFLIALSGFNNLK